MRRIAAQQARVVHRGPSPVANINNVVGMSPVRLTSKPEDLYILWNEYEFGINGSKPAQMYTAVERGRNKYSYSRRKIF